MGRGDPAGDPRVLLFDAFHDVFRGVVCLVEVVDGTLRVGDRVTAASSGETYDVAEVRSGRVQDSKAVAKFEQLFMLKLFKACRSRAAQ